MTVAVLTDSACSLPAQLAEERGVTVVPLWVMIGAHQYREGEIGIREVLDRMGEGVTTSGPSPGDLLSAMEAADEGDGVAVLTISSRMSSVYDAARTAALASEGRAVEVVDTGTAAGAQGLVALAAAEAASSGGDLAQVASRARAAAASTKLVATLPSLDHLARGGRVPGAAAWGARWLGLAPLFEFRAGRVAPMRPALSRKAACDRILAAVARDAPSGTAASGAAVHVAALHALEEEAARSLLGRLKEHLPVASSFVGSFGPVMVAHTGPGLLGLAWRWERG